MERGRSNFEEQKFADCKFCFKTDCGMEKTIHVNRTVLALKSAVFEELFFSDGTIARAPYPVFTIYDVSYETFYKMVLFIYDGKLEVGSVEEASIMMRVAKKYEIFELIQHCEKKLSLRITISNACQLLEFGEEMGLNELQEDAMKMIRRETDSIFNTDGFLDAKESTVAKILDQDRLQVCSELKLFFILEYYDEVNGTLSIEAVKKIRFRRMSLHNFQSGPLESMLLSENEKTAILDYLGGFDYAQSLPSGFSSKLFRWPVMSHRNFQRLNRKQKFIVQRSFKNGKVRIKKRLLSYYQRRKNSSNRL